MTRVFSDTSALIALRDAGDSNHERAVGWFNDRLSAGGVRLILTNYVLAETHSFFCRHPQEALAYAERIRKDRIFDIMRASAADEAEAWDILRGSADKTYSFVDAVSFAVMRRCRIASVLAFDEHFRQFGHFAVVP